ncbi:MAG: choice-of-anchor D domain-containing protein [Bacteroidales bacterium]
MNRTFITLLFTALSMIAFGQNRGAQLSFSTAELNFGDVELNQSITKTVTITNAGDAPWYPGSATLTEPFKVETMPGMVSPKATFDLNIVFTPTAEGDFSQDITFSGNHTNQDASCAIKGKGIAATPKAIIEFSAAELDFSDVELNQSVTKTVTITNTGDMPWFPGSATIVAPFKIETMPGMVSPKATFDLNIIFTPTEEGDFGQFMTFSGNHSNQNVSCAIKGKGIKTNVGLNELQAMNIKIGPNPFEDNLKVVSDFDIENITIFDVNGRILKSVPVGTKEYTLNLSELNQGVYLIHMKNREGSCVKKLIKK